MIHFTTEVKMEDKTTVTVKAVKEALDFIEITWGDWHGDFHDFVANVISEDTVTQYDVQHLLDAIARNEHVDGIETLFVNKRGSNYQIKVKR
tara:strand:- start:234 stop:509 length:276 start_codon:yes stop_codon:yes gene_type:complete